MKWHRTPFGYLSEDGQWFLERGGRMSHGSNAWLIWRQATDEDLTTEMQQYYQAKYGTYTYPVRSYPEVTGVEGDGWFVDACTEGGWLSEAKAVVEKLRKELQESACTPS